MATLTITRVAAPLAAGRGPGVTGVPAPGRAGGGASGGSGSRAAAAVQGRPVPGSSSGPGLPSPPVAVVAATERATGSSWWGAGSSWSTGGSALLWSCSLLIAPGR